MSPDELRALADQKEQEHSIRKTGFLKHDLYDYSTRLGYGGLTYTHDVHVPVTPQERAAIIEEFSNTFDLILPRGTKFCCFICDGEEVWEDDLNWGLQIINDPSWVEKHLENVQEV